MPKNEIELPVLRRAVIAILHHLIDDLGLKTVPLQVDRDFYWDIPAAADSIHRKSQQLGRRSAKR